MLAGKPANRPYGILSGSTTLYLSNSCVKLGLLFVLKLNAPDGRWPDLIKNELERRVNMIKREAMWILLFVLFMSTNLVAADNQLPDWLKEKTSKSKLKITVVRHEHEGKTYYLISSHVPDGYTNLYDSDGNRICAPWGGISGRGYGQCPDFVKDLKNGTVVWKGGKEIKEENDKTSD